MEYIRKHLLDLSKVLNLSLGDPIEIKDCLKMKTTSKYQKWNSQQHLIGSFSNFKLKLRGAYWKVKIETKTKEFKGELRGKLSPAQLVIKALWNIFWVPDTNCSGYFVALEHVHHTRLSLEDRQSVHEARLCLVNMFCVHEGRFLSKGRHFGNPLKYKSTLKNSDLELKAFLVTRWGRDKNF